MNFKMKGLQRISVLLTLTILVVASCKDEPCDAVVCQNDGTCVDGICECPPGFEGDLCEDFIRQKIQGNFDVASSCTGDTEVTDTWAIGASASSFNEVLINNFHKPALNVIGTITGTDSIEIKEQFIGGSTSYTISGFGNIEGEGQLSIQYTVIRDVPSDTTVCSVAAVRQ